MEPGKKIRSAGAIALVIPLANEASTFPELRRRLKSILDTQAGLTVYFVIDNASRDNTRELCEDLASADRRFKTVFEPANRHVVDAYLRGFREALNEGADLIIEMDGGLSHNPAEIPQFIHKFEEGFDCIFGSRFLPGAESANYPFRRRLLSQTGTLLSQLLLGTKLRDMTSGFEGFERGVLLKLLQLEIRSTAHFVQTEIRYLCRNCRSIEVPVSYHSPSARVGAPALSNALQVLLYYFFRRMRSNPPSVC